MATMTPEQQAAYAKSMSQMQSKAGAAAEQARASRYASLQLIPYPPPPPPIVPEAGALTNQALTDMQTGAGAKTAAEAQHYSQLAMTEATRALKKLEGATGDPRTAAIVKLAQQVVTASAATVAKWTKQPPAQVQAQMQQTATAQAAAAELAEANASVSEWSALTELFAGVELTWRFWVGVGAGVWGMFRLRNRSAR